MPEYQAEVKPHQPWNQDGTADVTPKPPFSDPSTFQLPLEHREGRPVTVTRSEYPEGLVIIPTGAVPSGDSAVLPMDASSENTIEIPNGGHQSWPDGIVARFTD